jgi:hypothetical protein
MSLHPLHAYALRVTPRASIESHRCEDDRALDVRLVQRREIQEVEAVIHEGEDAQAHDRSPNRSLAAVDRRTANEDGRATSKEVAMQSSSHPTGLQPAARAGLMRAWLSILRDRHPGVTWIPVGPTGAPKREPRATRSPSR